MPAGSSPPPARVRDHDPHGAQVRMNTGILILCAVAYVAVAVADHIERRR
jgi:hypothetical protein